MMEMNNIINEDKIKEAYHTFDNMYEEAEISPYNCCYDYFYAGVKWGIINKLIDNNMNMNFGEALNALKSGKKVARNGWNGKNMFLYYVPSDNYVATTKIAKETFGEYAMVHYEAYIAMKNAQGTVSIWNPSQVDMFAEDWIIVE